MMESASWSTGCGRGESGRQKPRWTVGKDIGASTALRKWFGHDPARWDEFRARYFEELDQKPAVVKELRTTAAKKKITLLFGARDRNYNNAVCVREYLESQVE